jgi:hypothetical protein
VKIYFHIACVFCPPIPAASWLVRIAKSIVKTLGKKVFAKFKKSEFGRKALENVKM